MNIKYVGMDIHKEAVVIAVMNGEGKVVMESIIETKASTILQCIQGIHGDLHVTLEEGTWSAWLYDLLKPHVTELSRRSNTAAIVSNAVVIIFSPAAGCPPAQKAKHIFSPKYAPSHASASRMRSDLA